MSKSTATRPTASVVREWAAENGLPAQPVGTRGRLPKATIEAFNKGRKGHARFVGNPAHKVTVSAKPEKGRTKSKTGTPAEIRAAAAAAGVPVQARGRLSKAAREAFVLGQA